MFHGVGQRRGAVPADHFHPLRHGRRQAAVLDLLDDQGADGRRRLLAILGIVFLVQGRPPQGQHGHHLRVRLVDVFLHGLFDLRGHVLGVARIPDRFAAGHHRRGQSPQQADRVGTLVEDVLAADRLDHAAIALADGHADAVALDQPPPLVGDRVGRLDRLQRGMDGAGEILQPGPEDLPVGEVPQLAALEEIAGPLAHFQQEAEIAALHGRPGVVPLQHLDHAHHFHFGPQGGQHEQEIGGVGRLVACTRARMRRRQYPFRRGHRLVEQAGVLGLGRLVVAEVGLLEVDLILQGQLAFLVDRPDGPANRRQRGNDPPQEFAVELAGRDVLPR